MRHRAKAPLALLAILALGGCGSQGQPETTSPPPQGSQAAAKADTPALDSIRRQFTAPKPDPRVSGSKRAIEAGEAACEDKTPGQVKAQFFPLARAHLNAEQLKAIESLSSLERRQGQDPSFAAGQLAAVVYAASLPPALNQFGYQGCVYGLALGVEG